MTVLKKKKQPSALAVLDGLYEESPSGDEASGANREEQSQSQGQTAQTSRPSSHGHTTDLSTKLFGKRFG